jgi:AraC family transcriptional regulator of adaptative response / DNA-3-methyladenine glycosylase II
MPARAETIRALARAVGHGTITFAAGTDTGTTVSALRAVAGIGDWTAQYVAMRALGEPDAFPSGDLVLRRVVGTATARELERRSEAWRPWRAYAVMLLWERAAGRTATERVGARRPGRMRCRPPRPRTSRPCSS